MIIHLIILKGPEAAMKDDHHHGIRIAMVRPTAQCAVSRLARREFAYTPVENDADDWYTIERKKCGCLWRKFPFSATQCPRHLARLREMPYEAVSARWELADHHTHHKLKATQKSIKEVCPYLVSMINIWVSSVLSECIHGTDVLRVHEWRNRHCFCVPVFAMLLDAMSILLCLSKTWDRSEILAHGHQAKEQVVYCWAAYRTQSMSFDKQLHQPHASEHMHTGLSSMNKANCLSSFPKATDTLYWHPILAMTGVLETLSNTWLSTQRWKHAFYVVQSTAVWRSTALHICWWSRRYPTASIIFHFKVQHCMCHSNLSLWCFQTDFSS